MTDYIDVIIILSIGFVFGFMISDLSYIITSDQNEEQTLLLNKFDCNEFKDYIIEKNYQTDLTKKYFDKCEVKEP